MKYFLISLTALFLVVLQTRATVETQRQNESGTPVPITPLGPKPCPTCESRGPFITYSGMEEPAQLVIKDSAEWKKVWERIHSTQSPVPPLPKIDFSREMVVLAALGSRATGGHGIVVDRAYECDNKVVVIVSRHVPGKNCFTTQALTQPVDIVLMPKTDRPVTFKETEVVHECK